MLESAGPGLIPLLTHISIPGAGLRGEPPAPLGTAVICTIGGRAVRGTIVRKLADGFAIKFDEELKTRIEMIRGFYAGNYVKAFAQVATLGVTTAVVRRLFD